MDEHVLGVTKEFVLVVVRPDFVTVLEQTFALRVVTHSQVLAENGCQHGHTVVGDGILEPLRVLLEQVLIALGFSSDVSRPRVEGVQALLHVQVLGTAQALGAEKVNDRDVNLFKPIRWQGQQFSEGFRLNEGVGLARLAGGSGWGVGGLVGSEERACA